MNRADKLNQPGWYVEIVSFASITDQPTQRLGPYVTERLAERADRGVNINLDSNRYFTRIRQHSPNKKTV